MLSIIKSNYPKINKNLLDFISNDVNYNDIKFRIVNMNNSHKIYVTTRCLYTINNNLIDKNQILNNLDFSINNYSTLNDHEYICWLIYLYDNYDAIQNYVTEMSLQKDIIYSIIFK